MHTVSLHYSWYILLDRRYTTMWFNVYIMQLTTELHFSTLQGLHQAYKIMELTKAHAVIPLFYKPDDGPIGSKHVAQLLVA